MSVPVIGLNGRPLMPTTERKARILLKEKKVKVICRHPFAIGLLHKIGCSTQEGCLGVDTGSRHVGIAATVGNRVVLKAEHTHPEDAAVQSIPRCRLYLWKYHGSRHKTADASKDPFQRCGCHLPVWEKCTVCIRFLQGNVLQAGTTH